MREFDYIIVGSGSAGGLLAARLSEDPSTSVLLLEAGSMDRNVIFHMGIGFYRGRPRAMGWSFRSEPEPHLDNRQIDLPQGRVLGGSSSVNGKMYMRGHPLDFDEWAQRGCRGWSYAEVLPYFKRSERFAGGDDEFHSGTGPLAVRPVDSRCQLQLPLQAAASELGVPVTSDFNGVQPEGFGSADTTVDARGRRASSARAFIRPALRRPNLTVVTNALASRILVVNGAAVGVEYVKRGRREIVHAAREVILAAGAYNSPKLLLLSGIGPAQDLEAIGVTPIHPLAGVGRNIQDHAAVWIANATKERTLPVEQLRIDRAAVNFLKWFFKGEGFFASQQCTGMFLLRMRESSKRPDVQVMCNALNHLSGLWWPGYNEQQHIVQAAIGLLHPQSRGWVKLRSADPQDAPRIQLNLLAEHADVEVFLRALRKVREIFASRALSPWLKGEVVPGAACASDAQLIAFLRANMQTARHPVGGCMMGIGEDAVVDPELKVRGIERLRVVDSSIMPTIPGNPTNAATFMIGEKAADLIRGRVARLAASAGALLAEAS